MQKYSRTNKGALVAQEAFAAQVAKRVRACFPKLPMGNASGTENQSRKYGRRATIKLAVGSLVGCLLLSLSLSGCASESKQITAYTLGNLPEKGFYVRKGENFFPVYAEGLSFTGMSKSDALEKRFFWHSNKEYLIPILNQGDEIIYRSVSEELPDIFDFENMTDMGYTLGCGFTAKTVGIGFAGNKLWIEKTSAFDVLDGRENLASYTVLELNNVALDLNLIDENGILAGLTPGKQYLLGSFEGTVYRELTMTADTRYYKSYAVRTVDGEAPYSLTRKGYAVVTLPSNLESGMYAINGEGVFYYDAEPVS